MAWESCSRHVSADEPSRLTSSLNLGDVRICRCPCAHAVSSNEGQTFETLSGGQQARLQILLLELPGASLLLLDEPTDNLDVQSAEALEAGLDSFDGTVVAVTHDRWFARGFDRYLVFGEGGHVYETSEPVWDEGRVNRVR